MSRKPTRKRRPPAGEVGPETPIWCPACQSEHPASAFNKESRRFSGLSGICREAQARQRQTSQGQAKTRRTNRRRWEQPEYREKSREWQRARRVRNGASADLRRARARLQAIVDEWKRQGCIDCGYDNVRAIDPDHPDAKTKDNHVSRLVQLCASATRIRAELAKCEPRCARCHRDRTKRQRPSLWLQKCVFLRPGVGGWTFRIAMTRSSSREAATTAGGPSGPVALTGTMSVARRSPAWPRLWRTGALGSRSRRRWPSASLSAPTVTPGAHGEEACHGQRYLTGVTGLRTGRAGVRPDELPTIELESLALPPEPPFHVWRRWRGLGSTSR